MVKGKDRLRQAQEEVEEVKVIMLDNLNKADERSGKLGELENRADVLLEKSKGFKKTATKLKQKNRWENMKMKVVVGGILAVVVVVVLVVLVTVFTYSSDPNDRSAPPAPTATNGT